MSVELIFAALLLLTLGLLIGWLLGGRSAASVRAELAGVSVRAAQAELLRRTLDQVESEREAANQALAAERATAAARTESFEARLRQSTEAKDALGASFAETAAKVLDTAQRQFLERADARFKQSEEAAGQGLKALLLPVHERLEKYETSVKATELDRQNALAALSQQIETMRVDANRVATGADNIISALRHAPKARGNWGEQQLRNVLETCGLAEHTDFQLESSTELESGRRLRPDAVVRVPGGKTLIIDAKVSFNDYQTAIAAVDDVGRTAAFKKHADSMRGHVNSLNIKDYARAFGGSPDYVIMFVGGEHFLNAALEHDGKLWDYAWNKRVIIATPTNLVAIARTVSAVWRQEKLAKQAYDIGVLGKQMYDRLALVSERLGKAGGKLNQAVDSFNDATKTFNGDLAATGRRFRDLNLEVGARELEDVSSIDKLITHVIAEKPNVLLLATDADDSGQQESPRD